MAVSFRAPTSPRAAENVACGHGSTAASEYSVSTGAPGTFSRIVRVSTYAQLRMQARVSYWTSSADAGVAAGYRLAMELRKIHHVAVIASDYARSKVFYTEVLGLRVIAENYRAERYSWKLDLALADGTQVELFSFPDPPVRPTRPEACGLRHLAFAVDDVDAALAELRGRGVAVEQVRVDEYTGRRFAFFADPDGLPLELYEM